MHKLLTMKNRKSTKRCREVRTSLVLPFMAFMHFMVEAVGRLAFRVSLREMKSDLLAAGVALQRLVGPALLVFLAELSPFVVRRASLGEAELDLGVAALEVDPQRDEGVAALLKLRGEAADLLTVKQKPTIAHRVSVVDRTLLVRCDVNPLERRLAPPNDGEAVLDRAAAGAEGLDLRSGEDDPRLDPVEDVVLVACSAVRGDSVDHGGHRLAETCRQSKGSKAGHRQSNSLAKAPRPQGANTGSRASTMKDMKNVKRCKAQG